MSSFVKQLEIREKEFKEKGKAGRFLMALLNLTGREVNEAPLGTDLDLALDVLGSIWETIEALTLVINSKDTGANHESCCHLINQALAALGRENIDKKFYDVVFKNENCSDLNNFEKCVEKFRQFCIFYFGNFKFGFRKFHRIQTTADEEKFQKLWDDLFTLKEFQNRTKLIGIKPIDTDVLWCLGYLSVRYAKAADAARDKFLNGLKKVKLEECQSYNDLNKKITNFDPLHDDALLPPEANLLPVYDEIASFQERLKKAKEICSQPAEKRIEEMQRRGRQNTFAYLTMREIDVYFATSMRKPEHFYNAQRLINRLFKGEKLGKYNLRVFDPTQSFSHDRLDKGLTECLMIACSKITLYNAQDEDTFGKDAEAAVSLAQAHPVIVYVARLFAGNESIKEIYKFVDLAPKMSVDDLYEDFKTRERWDFKYINNLEKEPLSKDRLISDYLDKKLLSILTTMESNIIRGELINYGYSLSEIGADREKLIKTAIDYIKKFERRALIFLEGHPLSMQTSPKDGVARGVIVTRSVEDTENILFALLTNTMEYVIIRDEYCWKLCEKNTSSPIRVITTDSTLTSAYWDKFLEHIGDEWKYA